MRIIREIILILGTIKKHQQLILILMKFLGIIPARYASTRLPGKPLAKIGDKTMIRRVYERAKETLEHIIIATDNQMIVDEVKNFGGIAVMTSDTHKSGTSRCKEALDIYEKLSGNKFNVVINIQGDEPFISREHLVKLMLCFENPGTEIATLIKEISDNEDVFNQSKPKVIINKNNEAIYFSRSPIPFVRDVPKNEWHLKHNFYKHIGIYAYKTDILREIIKLKSSSLEIAEALEQNCWIENGYKIMTEQTEIESLSVDTKEDLEKAVKLAKK